MLIFTSLITASFTNGRLVPEKAHDFKFACYGYEGPKKTLRSKRLLVRHFMVEQYE